MTNVTCPVCIQTSEDKAWESATARIYEIVPMSDPMADGCYWICPCCRKESVGYLLGFDTLVMA